MRIVLMYLERMPYASWSGGVGICGASLSAKFRGDTAPGATAWPNARVATAPAAAAPTANAPPFNSSLRLLDFVDEPTGSSLKLTHRNSIDVNHSIRPRYDASTPAGAVKSQF